MRRRGLCRCGDLRIAVCATPLLNRLLAHLSLLEFGSRLVREPMPPRPTPKAWENQGARPAPANGRNVEHAPAPLSRPAGSWGISEGRGVRRQGHSCTCSPCASHLCVHFELGRPKRGAPEGRMQPEGPARRNSIGPTTATNADISSCLARLG